MADPAGVRGANRAIHAVRRSLGLDPAALPRRAGAADRRARRQDKRFADAAWRDNPYFDLIKQAYVLTTRWADDLVKRADEMDPHDRDKAQFYLRQVTAALSPSNFVDQSGAPAHDARGERRKSRART